MTQSFGLATGLATGFGDVSLSMLDGDEDDTGHHPCPKIFSKVFDSLGAVADFVVGTRVLVALLATFAFLFGLALAAMPSPANAAALLAADGVMGFAGPDACGTAVQGGVAQGYEPPTTAIRGRRTGYKNFTLAELGKANGLCVTGDTKYKVGTVVYLPPTFVVAVNVDKAGNPVANWWVGMRMGKCDNEISQIWIINPKPAVVPATPAAAPTLSPTPPVVPAPKPALATSVCELDTRSGVYLCEGPKPDNCGCYILASSIVKKDGTRVPQKDLWFPKAHNDTVCTNQQQLFWTSRGGGKFKTVQVGS